MNGVGPLATQRPRQRPDAVEALRPRAMFDDLDAVGSERFGKGSEPEQGVDPHVRAVASLVLGEEHDESLGATDVERIDDMV